ncbi:S8 family serine peptidase [Catenulispora subtropica]|uniref:S8 family serine peptidase n=1 Tax=Catenulispora subtropica TaxID=450798 RepID=UPI0031CDFE70
MSRRWTSLLGACAVVSLAALPPSAYADDPAPVKPAVQWPLTYLKADQVWQLTKGSGVTVGLVDSGVSPLGDTRANLLSGADFSEGATSSGIAHIDTDTDSHGTTMAVLIAGTGGGAGLRGLAPEAKILPVRMQKQTGEDPVKITDAVKFATAQHVKVINMSLGTAPTPELAAAVKAAQDADIVVVAAAGNGGGKVITPASYPGVVAVGAVDSTGTRWASSSYGPQVALMGPGVEIPVENADGVPKTVRGTSNATAYVTASAALVRALHPDWTAGQTIRVLLATATKAGGASGLTRNDQYGYGIVNPLAALNAGAPVAKDNPLVAGAAALAAALPANAPSASPSTPAPVSSSSASPAPTPSTAPPTNTQAVENAAKAAATEKSGLLSSRRNKILAACAGVAVLGFLLLLLNRGLKRRELRRNRAWH